MYCQGFLALQHQCSKWRAERWQGFPLKGRVENQLLRAGVLEEPGEGQVEKSRFHRVFEMMMQM